MTPALPPGFQLEATPSGPVSITVHGGANTPPPAAAPPLPPGFQLESPNTTQPAPPPQSLGDQLSAGFTRGLDALPFGNKVLEGAERLKGLVQGRTYEDVASSDEAQAQANPTASTVGTVSGSVLPFVVGGEIPAVAKVLGMDASMPMLTRILLGGATQGAMSGADAYERTGDLGQATESAGIGALTGGAAAPIGDILSAGGKAIAPIIDKLTNTDRAAQKVVGRAADLDVQGGNALSQADEVAATQNGQPIINADRYGQNTRTLARTAANTDPAADGALKQATGDRFTTQNQRAVAFVKDIAGGNVDDLALQDQVAAGARRSNAGAYGRAYADPAARSIWTLGIKQLFQSPDFVNAVKGAERTAANDAAANGMKAVRSPFIFDAKGNIQVRRMPDGSVAKPNLPFWDVVQRNLRTASEEAYSGGKKLLGGQLKDMRTQLVNELDSAVPSFQRARQGAAAAFGAEDAIDAGRKFVSQRMGIPEARRAYAKFTPAERKAFGVGFASELIDKINSVSDRVNVINQVFGSPAARQQVELALGKGAADRLDAFTRVEDIMQQTNAIVNGNSSTAKQLIAAGVIGGTGGFLAGGHNPFSLQSWGAAGGGAALFMAAGRAGSRILTKDVDQRVMTRVAQILSSQDPAELQKAVKAASHSPAIRAVLQAIETGLHAGPRALAAMAPKALQITVNGGEPTAIPAPG